MLYRADFSDLGPARILDAADAFGLIIELYVSNLQKRRECQDPFVEFLVLHGVLLGEESYRIHDHPR